jgi:hypothetical protein
MAATIAANQIDIPASKEGHLFLMDRGYRSADLFNKIHQAGHDYICRLTRTDGRVVGKPIQGEDGHAIELPQISEAAREADEY